MYKKATETVLKRWETEKDRHGHPQKWKIVALEEDRNNGKESGVVEMFVEEVERELNILEMKPIEKSIDKVEENQPVAAEPITPHGV